jgi:prepilin-type N-terminal cleavage/methylation domain-containing protein
MIKAFTLIELVFVIVIIGILSTQISPNFQSDGLQKAANQLITHLRYTQHLAMMDNKFDPRNSMWFKERWQLKFSKSVQEKSNHSGSKVVWSYTIFSGKDRHHDRNPRKWDIAKDPINKNVYLSGGHSGYIHLDDKSRNKDLALRETYGIESVEFSRSCSHYGSKKIIFDYIGRPYYYYQKDTVSLGSNPYKDMKLIRSQCQISLCLKLNSAGKCDYTDKNSYIKIAIEPETGYSHIL